MTQARFADDSACWGKLRELRTWWDSLLRFGQAFGYFPNAVKTWLVVKPEEIENAVKEFEGTGVNNNGWTWEHVSRRKNTPGKS